MKSDEKILRRLENTPHPIADDIGSIITEFRNGQKLFTEPWVHRIEQDRRRLLNREDRLADGTFGEEGMYDEDVSIQEACAASRDPVSAQFLHLLIRLLKPRNAIELGTNVGISSAYIGVALQINGNRGTLVTLDASPYRQKLAKEVHQNLKLNNIKYVQGLFQDTLEDTLEKMGRVDFAFIDGHHQYKPTLEYLEKIYSFTTSGAVLLFDDIRYSKGMIKAWSEIKDDKRFDLVIDLKNIGVCVCAGNKNSRRFVIPTIHTALESTTQV